MRVLALLTDAYGGYGGIAVYNRDLLQAVCGHPRIDSVIALPRRITHPLEPMPSALDYRVDASSGVGSFLWTVAGQAFANTRPALIYCAHINLAPLAMALRMRWRAPVLVGLYGIECWQPTGRRMADAAVRRIDRFFAISRLTRSRFSSWSGVPENRISLLPNAIQPESFGNVPPSPAVLARYDLAGRTVLLTLGRIVSKERAKGFDEVLDALPVIRRHVPDVLYVIAGGGDYRATLEAKVLRLGLAGHVVFTGHVSEAEKVDLYRAARAYVMPSRGEGFGFVFLEALACGTPCVASSVDGSRDAVRDGELGAIVDPDDQSALVAAILAAIAKPRMIPSGLKHFAFPAFTQRVHDIIDGMVAKQSQVAA